MRKFSTSVTDRISITCGCHKENCEKSSVNGDNPRDLFLKITTCLNFIKNVSFLFHFNVLLHCTPTNTASAKNKNLCIFVVAWLVLFCIENKLFRIWRTFYTKSLIIIATPLADIYDYFSSNEGKSFTLRKAGLLDCKMSSISTKRTLQKINNCNVSNNLYFHLISPGTAVTMSSCVAYTSTPVYNSKKEIKMRHHSIVMTLFHLPHWN